MLTVSSEYRKKVAVFSHERSGTHFLMNSIALNFSYISSPWWNFDWDTGLNFYHTADLIHYFQEIGDRPVLNILKSHHSIEFLKDILPHLPDHFCLLYIYRDPRDLMISFRRFIMEFKWYRGPDTSTIGQFIRSAPAGAALRYQKKQEQNILRRWANHVDGWLQFIDEHPDYPILPVAYEALNQDFEKTMMEIGKFLNSSAVTFQRPSTIHNVISVGSGKVGAFREVLSDADHEFIVAQTKSTMKRLGYI